MKNFYSYLTDYNFIPPQYTTLLDLQIDTFIATVFLAHKSNCWSFSRQRAIIIIVTC